MAMLMDVLLQRLREFFIDVTEANVEFHLGDLFDPSQFRLRDVFLRTELINALHLPFELKAAYIGDVKVEGLVGFVAGTPLTITVDNVCLVLGHKPVDWTNELALRYAKELLLALVQTAMSFLPGNKRKAKPSEPVTASDASFIASPTKWILNKILATIAETTVKLERLHIRFESEHEGQPIAYGVHIPTFQLSSSDLDDQILRRREQPGVTYPSSSSDHTACKRLYLANVAVYFDLNATSFLGPKAPRQTPTTPRGSTIGGPPNSPGPSLSQQEQFAHMRQQCQMPFTPNEDRDLVLVSALWLKLDFVRPPHAKPTSPLSWGLGAIDVVTEDIKVNVDFTQLAALNDELARVTSFFQREQRRTWRPSHVDRERVAPLRVAMSTSTLLPIVDDDVMRQLTTDKHSRYLSRAWLRGMWRYATRSVLVEARNGDPKRVRFGSVAPHDDQEHQQQREADHERYLTLYTRSLSDDNLRLILFGRTMLPGSPRATASRQNQDLGKPLAVYAPLSLAEAWELSDLVERLSLKDQRALRNEAAQRVRHDYTAFQSGPATTPTATDTDGGSTRVLSIEIPETSDAATGPEGRTSGRSISPKHATNHSTPVTSPTSSQADGHLQLPPDFVANHHHHYTRSRAESSPTKQQSVSQPSPTGSSVPHLTHSASAPVTRHKPSDNGTSPTRAGTGYFSFRSPPSPTNLSKPQWFVESLLPSWLLLPSRVIPLINWHIGPLSLRLHHRIAVDEIASVFPVGSSLTDSRGSPPVIPPRSSDSFLDASLESCTGCALLCKAPSVSVLVELRLGLVKASLVDLASSFAAGVNAGTTGNSITTDYIREPSDGFFYLGLKYNFKHATRGDSLLAAADEPLWDIKAKLCVGTVHIEYNDMTLQAAIHSDLKRRSSATSLAMPLFATQVAESTVPPVPSTRLGLATYVTIVQDVLSNWKTFIQRVQPTKAPLPVPDLEASLKPPSQDDTRKQLKRAATQARVTKLLNALMQQSSCVDIDTNGIELQLSVLTSHVVEKVAKKNKSNTPTSSRPLNSLPPPLFDSEQVQVTLPNTSAGLQNRPLLNECQINAGGVRVKFRTTKQGRAAVIDHVLHRLFPSSENATERAN